jgi:cytochrome c oxidase cbb3-type subunit 3
MAVSERDPHTGEATTGHEWNGIKELNTPVPKPVWFFLITTFLFAVGYWILMPAWPVGWTYTKGLLGVDQRINLQNQLKKASAQRAAWMDEIAAKPYAQIKADPKLMDIVRTSGKTLFGDNCAVCHGLKGEGGPGFPNLAAHSWLWGGSPEEIEKTIAVGINSNTAETRVSQMLAFGRDGMLPPADILKVVSYVQSLSGQNSENKGDLAAADIEAGREIFTANCVSCHGEDAKGLPEMGAPNLTDNVWINGGSHEAIYKTVYGGRQGYMPHWEGRLTPTERKLLTLYVLDLKPETQK